MEVKISNENVFGNKTILNRRCFVRGLFTNTSMTTSIVVYMRFHKDHCQVVILHGTSRGLMAKLTLAYSAIKMCEDFLGQLAANYRSVLVPRGTPSSILWSVGTVVF